MTRVRSTQVFVLMRLLDLCNQHPDKPGFTLAYILKWPIFKKRKTPTDSAAIALTRFDKLGITASFIDGASGVRHYKIKDASLARAYIENDPKKPWIPLTPTPPTEVFPESDDHRDHFDVKLSMSQFEGIRDRMTVDNNQYTLKVKEFTLSVNGKSLYGQIFVRPYWRTKVKTVLGEEFYAYLVDQEVRGGMKGDFALPIDVVGDRFTIGGRPTQFSASHYTAQLDIRRSKNDKNIVDGLYALTNQADFNVKTLDHQDMMLEVLTRQGEVQTKMSGILKAQEEVQTRIAEILGRLEKRLGAGPESKGEEPYAPPVVVPNESKWDRMYG